MFRAGVDAVAAVDLAAIREADLFRFREEITAGNHLRLPRMTSNDGPATRAAMRRVLAASTSTPAGPSESVLKEEKMRRVLFALERAARGIFEQSQRRGGFEP